MKSWTVSERNYRKLEKLRPKGRQQNVVIQWLLQTAEQYYQKKINTNSKDYKAKLSSLYCDQDVMI